MLGGMVVSGGAAVGLERVAYRPLRKRNAPSLVFLITAIGASFVIQEFVHYVLPQLTDGELGGVNAQVPIRLVAAGGAVHHLRCVGHQHHADHRSSAARPRARHRHLRQPDQVRPRHPRRRPGPDDRDADGCLAANGSSC